MITFTDLQLSLTMKIGGVRFCGRTSGTLFIEKCHSNKRNTSVRPQVVFPGVGDNGAISSNLHSRNNGPSSSL